MNKLVGGWGGPQRRADFIPPLHPPSDSPSCAVFGGQGGQCGPAGSSRLTALMASELHRAWSCLYRIDSNECSRLGDNPHPTPLPPSQEAARQSFLFKEMEDRCLVNLVLDDMAPSRTANLLSCFTLLLKVEQLLFSSFTHLTRFP